MIIRNFKLLSTTTAKKYSLSIIEAGLQSALPSVQLETIVFHDHLTVLGKKYDLKKYDNVFVVAMGKAAYSMTESVNSLTRITHGLIVVPKKTKTGFGKNFKVIQAGHPLPNKNSVVAAKKILEFLKDVKPKDFVIFLISGGTSSLVALPDGITLKEK
ncbi:MAG: DUF4147 domain-containing protein, partial [Candidatus Nitrosotalea sp.]|nr:DUF4147 domain-containing protein [Candidatus Nitrosotalea sp.]